MDPGTNGKSVIRVFRSWWEKKGWGWDEALFRLNLRGVPIKKEGDERAPAGIFRLSTAFGYAPTRSVNWIKLPYLALSKSIEGIDDPGSLYYNRLVDRSKVTKVDWRSSEQMRRDDVRYKWGVVIDHNPTAYRALDRAYSCTSGRVRRRPQQAARPCENQT